jgi:transposase
LEALISIDSHNSSRPPSTDSPWAKRMKSLRRPSGKRPGAQTDHRGETLRLAARPDRVVEHRPQKCRGCHAPLAAARVVRHLRQQVWEVVPARLRVTEHRAEVVCCPRCGARTKGEFPAGVRAPVQYGSSVKARVLYLLHYQLLPYGRVREALGELFGCWLSQRTLERMVAECAGTLLETELKIKKKLRRSPVLHADETGLRVTGGCHYVHVASTGRLTHYGYDAHRGRRAIDDLNILPNYRGTYVHDGWMAYNSYSRCRHALCGAHLLRELTSFAEFDEARKRWAERGAEIYQGLPRAVR